MATTKVLGQYRITFSVDRTTARVNIHAFDQDDVEVSIMNVSEDQTRSILKHVFEVDAVVEEHIRELFSTGSISETANRNAPLIFDKQQLVRFGFNPDDLEY